MFWITASGASNATQYAPSGFQARQRDGSETTAWQAKGIFSDNARQRAGCRYLNVLAARGRLALAGDKVSPDSVACNLVALIIQRQNSILVDII